jgi:DNA-binding CsgD family transcriptional regulator/tetratricopeptide (TPR) repeat protein
LAYHFAEAEPFLGPGKLVRYSLLAGEWALAAHAYEEALAYFQRGLAAKEVPLDGTEPARDAEEAALLFGAGYALAALRDHRQMTQTVSILRCAFDYYVRVGDLARAVTVAESTPRTYVDQDFGEADLVSRAMELVAPDSREAGYLLARYGEVRARVEGDYDDAQEAFSRAQAIARQEGDVALEMRVLAKWAVTAYSHLRNQECLEKSLRIIQLARLANEPIAEANAYYYAGMALWSVGDLEGSRRHGAALLALAERLRDRFWLASAFWRNESIARAEGDWRTARSFSDQGLALAAPRLLEFLSTRVYTEYQAGEFSQGEMYLERLLGVMRQIPLRPSLEYALSAVVIPMVARITGALDQGDIAEGAARAVLSSSSASPRPILLVSSGLALLATLRQDGVAARKQYLALEAERGTMLPPTVSMAADHLLGLLAQTMGWLDQAVTHFENALAFCRKAGYRPELAWTCYDYAEALLAEASFKLAPTLENRATAVALLGEGLSIASELGMRPLTEWVQALQEKAAEQPMPVLVYPAGLTQREVEVLRLIANGKSNREIAQSLILSVKTVDRHVSNIFAKTGTSNRTEASWYATRHQLVSS